MISCPRRIPDLIDAQTIDALCEPFGISATQLRLISTSQNDLYEHGQGAGQSIQRGSHGRGRTLEQVWAELAWIEDIVTRFDRVPGRKIEHVEVTDDSLARLGRVVAQLHVGSFDAPMPAMGRFPRPMWHASRLLTDDLQRYVPEGPFHGAVAQLVDGLRRDTDGQLGLVHADVSCSNAFLDGDRLWLFDFDNCEVGSIAQDLTTVLYDSVICRPMNRVPDDQLRPAVRQRWSALLAGYRAVRPLPSIAPDLIRRFLVLREALIYIHLCGVIEPNSMTDGFRDGMEQMWWMVVEDRTAIDPEALDA